jgi:uncharacterized phiE125 gp8 family phage protein
MGLRRVTGPEASPVTLEQAKLQCKVDSDDEDELIQIHLDAAIGELDGAEGQLNRALMTQTWILGLDGFPGQIRRHGDGERSGARRHKRRLVLPLAPLQSVAGITYLDSCGVRQTLDPTAYVVSPGPAGVILPALGQCWPYTAEFEDAVEVEFTAGYEDADSVPAGIKAAILLLVAHFYKHREAVVGVDARDSSAELPLGFSHVVSRLKFIAV